MKLATYQDGSRDGQLVVVSRDLRQAHHATGIATRLQDVLDDWNFLAPQLQDLSVTLNQGRLRHAFNFEPRQCMAPLPRAYQWVDASAYTHHLELLRRARGQALPDWMATEAPMYQGGSDDFLGPCDDACFASEDWGIDFEAELAVVTGDVAQGCSPEQALEGVRLLMLANDWSLRELIPPELAKGMGLIQGKPSSAFGPVAVTPDELGPAWAGGRVHLALQSCWNTRQVGLVEAGAAMGFHFGQLIAQLAKTRRVRAGSVVGSGCVSHPDRRQGVSCIAELRALEALDTGEPLTSYLRFGDTLRIEMLGRDGVSVFGAIEQRVLGLDGTGGPDATQVNDTDTDPG